MSVQGLHGRAAANPELGIVTITAKPLTLDRVAAYVESVNSRFARNVMVDVKIGEPVETNGMSLDDRDRLIEIVRQRIEGLRTSRP